MAPMACSPANAKSPSKMDVTQQNQTVFTGVFVNLFILYKMDENGRAPSREKANVCRDAARTWIRIVNRVFGSSVT